MSVTKEKNGKYRYSFTLAGHERERQRGYKTKAEAQAAEDKRRKELISGAKKFQFATVYADYMAATEMKVRSRDSNEALWERVGPQLGHLYVEEVDTSALDAFKLALPGHLAPKSVNNYLGLVRAVLGFAWKRGKLAAVPYVPMVPVPKKHQDWYTEEERDRLLRGIFAWRPQWYLFFYLTTRLGLRRGEIYAIERRQVRAQSAELIVDQAATLGTRTRPVTIAGRKNDEAYTVAISEDVLEAIQWHIDKGYGGPKFLFSKDGNFPRYLDNHEGPLEFVQKTVGLRPMSHHRLGRHSVASQAATRGESMKVIQAQLGHRSEASTHKYAHLGSKAQLGLVKSLAPKAPPHVRAPSWEMSGHPQGTKTKKALNAETLSA